MDSWTPPQAGGSLASEAKNLCGNTSRGHGVSWRSQGGDTGCRGEGGHGVSWRSQGRRSTESRGRQLSWADRPSALSLVGVRQWPLTFRRTEARMENPLPPLSQARVGPCRAAGAWSGHGPQEPAGLGWLSHCPHSGGRGPSAPTSFTLVQASHQDSTLPLNRSGQQEPRCPTGQEAALAWGCTSAPLCWL